MSLPVTVSANAPVMVFPASVVMFCGALALSESRAMRAVSASSRMAPTLE
jgi:hypothetical protein